MASVNDVNLGSAMPLLHGVSILVNRNNAASVVMASQKGCEAKGNRAIDVPLVTIVIPAFNEQASIQQLLNRVWAIPIAKQVIVVDDCSSDATHQLLLSWEHTESITILRHEKNRGKGAAIRTGLGHACGRFTVIQDADLEYDPEDIPGLISHMIEKNDESVAVYGSRYLADPIRLFRVRRVFELGIVLLNLAVRTLYGTKMTDEATCYKVFPTAALRAMQLTCERFEFCPEVTAKACRMGIQIHELPVKYHSRSVEEGKKIRARDGWEALCTLWKYRHWCPRFKQVSVPPVLTEISMTDVRRSAVPYEAFQDMQNVITPLAAPRF